MARVSFGIFIAGSLKGWARRFSLRSFHERQSARLQAEAKRYLTRVLRRIQAFGKVPPMRLEACLALCVIFLVLDAAPAWSQSKANFKAIPILQPMKDAAPTPDFVLTNAEGKKISLKDFRGKTLFLNFWATWCEPCREEMPAMEKLYQEYKDKNFTVLAVNVKDRRQEALAFVKEFKLTYPIAFDPNAEVATLYGAWGLPTTYIIGPKGEGLARGWGPAEWYSPASRNLFKELLEEKNGRR
jgi:peroxiredoxin